MPPQQNDWDVELKIDDFAIPLKFSVEGEVLVGRIPNGQAEMRSVDLTSYNGNDLGVSRRHGVFASDGSTLSYHDLGGGNGSILNGTALTPREPIKLTSGDVLHMGHLRAEVKLVMRPRKTTILATKPDFKLLKTVVQARGQRILVVEDDQGLAEMYRLALERTGFTVQTVREMVTAIRALNSQMPAAILLDLMLPGIRGLELARYVRRDTECPTVPIVIVSALRDKESVKSAMEAGADLFLGKPVDWKELTQVVWSLVDKSPTAPLAETKRLRGTARLDAIPSEMRRDTIVTFVEGFREPITVMVQPQVTLGRQNPNATARQHLDLEPYEAFDRGVSRVHATLRRSGDFFEVEDMNSANGTYINGMPINPGIFHALKNGDELRLGNLRLRLYFLAETELPRR